MLRLEKGSKLRDKAGYEYEVLEVEKDNQTRHTQYPVSYIVRRDDGTECSVWGSTINTMHREGQIEVLK